MSAFLPQQENALFKLLRWMSLGRNKRDYRYNYEHVADLAILDKLPISDEPKPAWVAKVASRIEHVVKNQIQIAKDRRSELDETHKSWSLSEIEKLGSSFKKLVYDTAHYKLRSTSKPEHATSIEDFASMFKAIDLPPVANDCLNDMSFALRRTMGPNPVMLKRVRELPDNFPVKEQHFERALNSICACPDSHVQGDGEDCLERALQDGRLYIVDYEELRDVELGTTPHGQKYLYAPMALFVALRVGKRLAPIAIQCTQTPSPTSPVFTPADGTNWLLAKTIVDIADGNYHEAGTHLGRTHLIIEPFVLASVRNLAWRHPLAKLLAPHFEGTFAINDLAWKHLISDGGAVDQLMGCSINTSRGFAVKAVQGMEIEKSMLLTGFADRGVDDEEGLPQYAYRDDSKLYWKAIHHWAKDYLGCYYHTDQDIQQDFELKAWLVELRSKEGGRVHGLPTPENLTLNKLVDIVTFVLFTCSVQHAAVNFPQYDQMSYIPNMPLAGYAPAPTSSVQDAQMSDYFKMLPPLDMAELQMNLGFMLGTIHYTALGSYDKHHFKDPRIQPHLARFHHELKRIGDEIEERNESRPAYSTLLPQGIPQSINI